MLISLTSIEGLIVQFFIFGIIGRAFLRDHSFTFVYWTDVFFVLSLILLIWILPGRIRKLIDKFKNRKYPKNSAPRA